MAFKKNVVKVDLCSYPPYMLLAPKKFGKTTFWYDLVREAWGSDDKGLLVSFGNEEGYHSLNGIQVEVCKEWDSDYDEETDLRGFVQVVDDIVENNSEYGLKGICFDTLDTMVDVLTKEVLRQHKKEKGTVCKTLNESFSGFGRGKARLLSLANAQIERLRSAGLAIFILCHIKNKEKTDMKSGEKYEQITNNLTDDIYSNFGDAAQMVMVGVLDREINNGKILNEDRVIYLRGTSTVDAGGRFTGLPEKISLSPKEFLNAFEMGVKNSIGNDVSDSTIEKMRKTEEKNIEKTAKTQKSKEEEIKNNPVDPERNAELISIIQTKFSDASNDIKKQVKEIMSANGFSKFSDPDIKTAALEQIVSLL